MILDWPTTSHVLTQRFLERPSVYNFRYTGVDGKIYTAKGHEGIDIVAPHGSQIKACADGLVTLVAMNGNTDVKKYPYGNQVRIKHDEGLTTIYAHLDKVLVRQNHEVKRGDIIGWADSTGNSSGSHLHLTVKKDGASLAGLTPFMNDIVDPLLYLAQTNSVPQKGKPNHPLRGLHGEGAADWMFQNNVKGWVTEVVYSHGDLDTIKSFDYREYEAKGIRVILRWNYSYASSDGGLGTYPKRSEYDKFISWVSHSILASRGVWGHIVGNEPNRAGERPDYIDENHKGTPILPSDVTYIYNAIWNAMPLAVRVSPPAIDPTNVETMDPKKYFNQIIKDIAGLEFFTLHAYSYGIDQPIDSAEKFQHMTWQYHSFRMWQPFASELYKNPMLRKIPLIITETNHLTKRDGNLGWEDDAESWIEKMYNFVLNWNRGGGDQYIHGVCLYRYNGDDWRIDNKQQLLTALKNNGDKSI